jgi:hypothetical protein
MQYLPVFTPFPDQSINNFSGGGSAGPNAFNNMYN